MKFLEPLKKIFPAIGNAGRGLLTWLGKTPPQQLWAVGAMIVCTAMFAALTYLVVYVIPNGEGNDVLLAKINVLGYSMWGLIGAVIIGVIGLFMLARMFGALRGAMGGASLEISAPEQPLSPTVHHTQYAPYAPMMPVQPHCVETFGAQGPPKSDDPPFVDDVSEPSP